MKISIDFDRYLRQQRIIGEMAGSLSLVMIVASDKQVNKEAIKDLLTRYEKEFEESKIEIAKENNNVDTRTNTAGSPDF